MRKFDHDGLLLAEYQGKLFEKSTELSCSTAVFLRRFLHSNLVKKLDTNDVAFLTLDVNEGIDNDNRMNMNNYSLIKKNIISGANSSRSNSTKIKGNPHKIINYKYLL